MLGRYYDPYLAPRFYSLLFFTFLLIPIAPLGVFLVSTTGGGAYNFYAEISRKDFNAVYKHGYRKLLLNGLGETVLVLGAALLALALLFGLTVIFTRH